MTISEVKTRLLARQDHFGDRTAFRSHVAITKIHPDTFWLRYPYRAQTEHVFSDGSGSAKPHGRLDRLLLVLMIVGPAPWMLH